jgi:hypothetical protein
MDFEPDHFLEEYWKNFKSFIIKLLREYKIISNYIKLNEMVNHLNQLKNEGKYIEIETCIEKYVLTIGWLLIKNYNNYLFHIFISRLKEWKNVPSIRTEDIKHKQKDKSNYLKFVNDLSFDIYIGIVNNLKSNSQYLKRHNYKEFLNGVHIPDYNDKSDIIKCCQLNIQRIKTIIPTLISDNKVGSLTILSDYLNLPDIILELYDVKIMPKTNGKKIIYKVNQKLKKDNKKDIFQVI